MPMLPEEFRLMQSAVARQIVTQTMTVLSSCVRIGFNLDGTWHAHMICEEHGRGGLLVLSGHVIASVAQVTEVVATDIDCAHRRSRSGCPNDCILENPAMSSVDTPQQLRMLTRHSQNGMLSDSRSRPKSFCHVLISVVHQMQRSCPG